MRSSRFLFPMLLAGPVLLFLIMIPAMVRSQSTSTIPGADLSDSAGATISNAPTDFSSPLGNSNGICPDIDGLTGMDAAELQNDISNCASNGFTALTDFKTDKTKFETQENILDGLGPVYNAKSCVDCHNGPVSGGSSQVTELRVGTVVNGTFVNPTVTIDYGQHTITGRSLINAQAICADSEENSPDNQTQRALRQSLTTLGDGFIESIADSTLINNGQNVCTSSGGTICGEVVKVPVLECTPTSCPGGNLAVGRFGWKSEHASLLSFSSDAYLNEMGITNRFNQAEVTPVCDAIADPEDTADATGLADIDHFARFMRATKAPPQEDQEDINDSGTAGNIANGKSIFINIGCNLCHTPQFVTAPAGTKVDAGAFVVPASLGSKIISPYSDFLLHNINTGDGIVQTSTQQDTLNKVRTAPLWAVSSRSRFLHDGRAITLREAILDHGGEAAGVITNFKNQTAQNQADLITFLRSL
jgi:CxxC motif-containing protein (DUF1111 family)